MRADPAGSWRLIVQAAVDVARSLPTPLLALKQAALIPSMLAAAPRADPGGGRIHAHFASLPTAVARAVAAYWRAGHSFTAHAHDIYVPENRRLLRRRIHDASLVLTCTAYNQRFLEGRARAQDRRKVRVAFHGLDFASYTPSEAREEGLIVGGASLEAKKGLENLIEACAALVRSGRRIRCVIIGEGPERQRLLEAIERHGLGDTITLQGRIPNSQVTEHLRRAAVLAHPSVVDAHGSMDGIPNFILEAMAVETPIVASDISGIPEVVHHGETGLLIRPGSVDELTAGLISLLDDRTSRERMGAAGRALVLERFDVHRNGAIVADALSALA
jgi:glycosyltransferase involved in cell wall biosynthesis